MNPSVKTSHWRKHISALHESLLKELKGEINMKGEVILESNDSFALDRSGQDVERIYLKGEALCIDTVDNETGNASTINTIEQGDFLTIRDLVEMLERVSESETAPKRTFFYVVEKELRGDDVEETTGWKNISVYEIQECRLVRIDLFQIENYERTEKAILERLQEKFPLEEFTKDTCELSII